MASPHMGGYYPPPQHWPPSEASVVPDPETEKKLLAIEELMKHQKIDFEKAQKELADRDAKEAAEKAAVAAAKKAKEEQAAWEKIIKEEKEKLEKELKETREAAEKKLEEEKKSAQAKGAENAKKQLEAERKKAEAAAAEEKEKEEILAKIKKLTEDAAAEAKKLREEAAAEQKKIKEEAAAEAEKLKKESADALAKALKKPEEDKKKPIKFKDAVGRKFSFPFHLCATWAVSEFSLLLFARLTDSFPGHGGTNQTSLSARGSYWSSCCRRPLRSSWTTGRDSSPPSLGDDDRTGLVNHHAHVAYARTTKSSTTRSSPWYV